MEEKSTIGIYGFGTIGKNLGLNILEHGYGLAVYAEDGSDDPDLSDIPHPEKLAISPSEDDFIASLEKPRKILLPLSNTDKIDGILARLLPRLEKGDLIADLGNSRYLQTEKRQALCAEKGVRLASVGIAGGPEGARTGPSLMVSGDSSAWEDLKPLFCAIAARTPDGGPCADWVGPGASADFVKVVHNAIEYADIELIAESYLILHSSLKASPDEIRTIYTDWNKTELNSYLIGITADIFGVRDEDGEALVDKVVDCAEQTGSGAWAVEAALELEVPSPILAAAVFARSLSARKTERVTASALLASSGYSPSGDRHEIIEELRRALLGAKVLAYAEGFLLLRSASKKYHWSLDLAQIARLWRSGSILSSPFLDSVAEAYTRDPSLPIILLDAHFKPILDQTMGALRKTAAQALEGGRPLPAMAAAISFYDGYRSTWLPANLIEAQRDRFGSHGYERVDRPRGEKFHSSWN